MRPGEERGSPPRCPGTALQVSAEGGQACLGNRESGAATPGAFASGWLWRPSLPLQPPCQPLLAPGGTGGTGIAISPLCSQLISLAAGERGGKPGLGGVALGALKAGRGPCR